MNVQDTVRRDYNGKENKLSYQTFIKPKNCGVIQTDYSVGLSVLALSVNSLCNYTLRSNSKVVQSITPTYFTENQLVPTSKV